jgi:hypothetical protein
MVEATFLVGNSSRARLVIFSQPQLKSFRPVKSRTAAPQRAATLRRCLSGMREDGISSKNKGGMGRPGRAKQEEAVPIGIVGRHRGRGAVVVAEGAAAARLRHRRYWWSEHVPVGRCV